MSDKAAARLRAPAETSSDSKRRLKMWVHMLRATRRLEGHLREYLRVHHNSTLPRFDVMAALHRHAAGITMSELSRMLLVSNGNVTAVVDRLEQDGLARRTASPSDRRSTLVVLTAAGRRQFEALAAGHERQVASWFSAMPDEDVDRLTAMMKRTIREDGRQ